MPAPTLQTDAFVLLKRPPADSFQSYSVFSPEHGALLVLQRVAKKSAVTAVPLDLFDEVSLFLESSNQGRTWFVKEARLVEEVEGDGGDRGFFRDALEHEQGAVLGGEDAVGLKRVGGRAFQEDEGVRLEGRGGHRWACGGEEGEEAEGGG